MARKVADGRWVVDREDDEPRFVAERLEITKADWKCENTVIDRPFTVSEEEAVDKVLAEYARELREADEWTLLEDHVVLRKGDEMRCPSSFGPQDPWTPVIYYTGLPIAVRRESGGCPHCEFRRKEPAGAALACEQARAFANRVLDVLEAHGQEKHSKGEKR